jgi:hypothetical protein
MSKLRQIVSIAIGLPLAVAGCVGIADRLLTIKGEISAASEVIPTKCLARLIGENGQVLKEDSISAKSGAGFLNPPRRGKFFIEIGCDVTKVVERKGPYYFETDFEIDLGRIVLR